MKKTNYRVFGDVLAAAEIGSWKIELDEGKAPRMYADATMMRLLGLDEEADISPENVYHAWYDRVDPAHYDAVAEGVSCMIEGKLAEIQYPWHHPDGRTIVVRCGGVRDRSYTAGTRVAGIHQWVTTMRHVDRDLEAQRRQLKMSLDAVTDERNRLAAVRDLINAAHWSFTLDENDNITKAEFIGDMEAVIGISVKITPSVWKEIVHPDDKEAAVKAFEAAIKDHSGRTPYDVTYRMIDKKCRYNWFRSAGKVIRNEDGTREFFGIHINVTERVLREQAQQKLLQDVLLKLARAVKAARAANKAKSEFLFNMSHDVRTPMNAICGFTAMAKKYLNDSDRVGGYLEKIDISGRQLLSLINQVFEMSRIEAGKMEIVEEPFDIRERFESIVTVVSAQARSKGVVFHHSVNDVRNFNVLADDAKMGQITLNIIGNAIKYTPEGGRVDFMLREMESRKKGYGTYLISVYDTGIGMSREFLKKIFEPFVREKTSTVSKIQGTGLGMAIVKNLVNLLGGKIDIQSEHNKGTKIDITIDLKLCETNEKRTEPYDIAGTTSFVGRRVLLVEDNEMNREIAKGVLEEYGFVVDEAGDGDVAVEKVCGITDEATGRVRSEVVASEPGKYDIQPRNVTGSSGEEMTTDLNLPDRRYDFVLMDVQMPKMDGYEATRRIREWEKRNSACGNNRSPVPRIPVIALTANAFEEDRQNALAAGMDEHLAKPIEVRKLLGTLAKCLVAPGMPKHVDQ